MATSEFKHALDVLGLSVVGSEAVKEAGYTHFTTLVSADVKDLKEDLRAMDLPRGNVHGIVKL